jgi:hypothetical protein
MNPIESWHAVLKHKQINKTTVKQFSLKGIIRHVEVYAKEYDTRAETRRHQFWTRHNPLWKDFEALKEFPYPVQNLLAKEIRLAKDLCVENDEQLLVSSAPEADSQGNAKPPICGKPCWFFEKWQLPCSHIWRQHMLFRVLTSEAVSHYSFVWKEGGFEHYETTGTKWVERDIREAIGAPVRKRIDVREVLDGLIQQYFCLEEEIREFPPLEAERVVNWWIQELSKRAGSMEGTGLEQFMAAINLGDVEEAGEDGLHRAGGSGTGDWDAQLAATAAYVDPEYDLAAAQAGDDAGGPPTWAIEGIEDLDDPWIDIDEDPGNGKGDDNELDKLYEV